MPVPKTKKTTAKKPAAKKAAMPKLAPPKPAEPEVVPDPKFFLEVGLTTGPVTLVFNSAGKREDARRRLEVSACSAAITKCVEVTSIDRTYWFSDTHIVYVSQSLTV